MSNTFGDFVMSVAMGETPSRTMTKQESEQCHREFCEAIGPEIQALRQEQRLSWQHAHRFWMD